MAGRPPPSFISQLQALVTLPVHHMTFLPRVSCICSECPLFRAKLGNPKTSLLTPTARESPKITLQFHNSGLTEFRKAILLVVTIFCSVQQRAESRETRHDQGQHPTAPPKAMGGQHFSSPSTHVTTCSEIPGKQRSHPALTSRVFIRVQARGPADHTQD